MPNAWVPWTLAAAASAAAGLYLLSRRPKLVAYANAREEQLTRRLAQVLGCSLAQALPAVRREIDLGPRQSDETLVKRAAYHYRQDYPETSCQVFQDPVPG